ncbi:PIN domain-containing protein [Dyella sp. M7H15-1]|uniref:type II toxin-antitoxin system VapC family toxin n=1 Tax=Dyella sp. M7H15-1 TaxID=2501295 RepID=UPI001004DB49|nr:PIN domain-containing protein [Dyella sp. M7H15-1]QAU23953.1 PIN domain-containing protein [Dyella sp. M7H15-1]
MILADSGFWIALGSRRDRHHKRAVEAAKKYSAEGFVTTWPVLTEVVHLIAHRVHPAQAIVFVRDIARGAATVTDLPETALHRIETLMQRYANLPMDLADASLIVLAEELGEGRILSTDARDFDGYRWKSRKPFTNLLLAG